MERLVSSECKKIGGGEVEMYEEQSKQIYFDGSGIIHPKNMSAPSKVIIITAKATEHSPMVDNGQRPVYYDGSGRTFPFPGMISN